MDKDMGKKEQVEREINTEGKKGKWERGRDKRKEETKDQDETKEKEEGRVRCKEGTRGGGAKGERDSERDSGSEG